MVDPVTVPPLVWGRLGGGELLRASKINFSQRLDLPIRMTSIAAPALDFYYVRRPRWWLALIVVIYTLLAVNFAINTPAWQAPDEPAHYNYIAYIATQGQLPVLQAGDYDQEFRDYLLANNFPAGVSVASLRYEFYQPPLYYLLGALIYGPTGGSLLVLRLLGVLLGIGVILLLYYGVALVFPDKPLVTLGATAFTAFLPMHVAVTAAVTIDTLAEVLLFGAIALLLRWMGDQFGRNNGGGSASRTLLFVGVLIGLGLLTKIYAYAFLPLALLTVIGVVWLRARTWRSIGRGVGNALYVLLPALLLGLPLWLRNLWIYGGVDLLGLTRHDQVVVGQPQTGAWIAEHGFVSYSERAFSFTFQSFWGVFGWMGIFMDNRIYTAMLIFSGVLFLGLLWTLMRLISGKPDTDLDDYQRWVLIFFALLIAAVTASYIWYNTKFVQHQGRYFFWGLLPISTFVALGWREVMRPLQGAITGLLAAILALSLLVSDYVGGGLNKWTILTIGLIAALLLLQPLLLLGTNGDTLRWAPQWLHRLLASNWLAALLRALRICAWAAPFALLALLGWLIPQLYILPQLAP